MTTVRKYRVALFMVLAGAYLGGTACGPPKTGTHPPQNVTSDRSVASDGGLPPPVPSKEKGIIVPSDTSIGGTPPGAPSDTGTSGRSVGPNLGN